VAIKAHEGRECHKILVMGGKDAYAERTESVEIYDTEHDTWTVSEELAMLKPKSGFACVTINSVTEVSMIGLSPCRRSMVSPRPTPRTDRTGSGT
jgi:hypothetical protein